MSWLLAGGWAGGVAHGAGGAFVSATGANFDQMHYLVEKVMYEGTMALAITTETDLLRQ